MGKIRQALREEAAHKASDTYYRGDFEDDESVLHALFKLYHYKCAYCEAELSNCQSALQVEHYRPKKANPAGENVAVDPSRHHKSYYWLAYEWSNLLLSCSTCNGGKGSKFPIDGQRQEGPQAPSNFKDPSCLLAFLADQPVYINEKPLLLNPELDEPSQHFGFTTKGSLLLRTKRAKETAKLCKLNRELLCSDRKKILDKLLLEFKEAAAQLIFSKIDKAKINPVRRLLFKPLFDRVASFGAANQQYSAYKAWIRDNLPEIVDTSLPRAAGQVILPAWGLYQRGWK